MFINFSDNNNDNRNLEKDGIMIDRNHSQYVLISNSVETTINAFPLNLLQRFRKSFAETNVVNYG